MAEECDVGREGKRREGPRMYGVLCVIARNLGSSSCTLGSQKLALHRDMKGLF